MEMFKRWMKEGAGRLRSGKPSAKEQARDRLRQAEFSRKRFRRRGTLRVGLPWVSGSGGRDGCGRAHEGKTALWQAVLPRMTDRESVGGSGLWESGLEFGSLPV